MNYRIERILYKKEISFWEKVLLFPLYLLSLAYGCVVRGRSLLYTSNLIRVKSLPCPVISVGNITVGGAGKTPLVIALADWLMDKGIPVCILSRGYKGERDKASLVSDGKGIYLTPKESGDEPFLMARILRGIPIFVGKDRFENGKIALQRFNIRGVILDDGYQYLQLHRDINILLIDSQIGFGNYSLLPRGILREPIQHIRRANIFLMTKVENLGVCRFLEEKIRKIHPTALIFHSHFEPVSLVGFEEECEEIITLKGKKVVVFSGIGNPDYFSSLVRRCGVEIVKEVLFSDHHLYTDKDIALLERQAKGVDLFLTTEKDMVKIKDLKIGFPPIKSLRIRVVIWEEEFYQKILEIF